MIFSTTTAQSFYSLSSRTIFASSSYHMGRLFFRSVPASYRNAFQITLLSAFISIALHSASWIFHSCRDSNCLYMRSHLETRFSLGGILETRDLCNKRNVFGGELKEEFYLKTCRVAHVFTFSSQPYGDLLQTGSSAEIEKKSCKNSHIRLVVSVVTSVYTPWLLVRKRTIPTERPPLFGEVSSNFCG
jgi:hypothetical protein